ncbi:division/cell wall cluster transcriptional repressor MraZ [Paragemmobacter straminiformis]|uniref:Transcriptional regulator MraZ n=1 Tax=Paragemmobacter straminiformis TaxID=2045119 RepID=A0A842ICG5_9RHOB|nr:division/cell wall cluster transcriptional repressor MraZ [Gemmobacter straminiformis]MBC2837279.1 division/cell wall cluster transcriptional repressor MraZ [Gemmobacter straminiformis]
MSEAFRGEFTQRVDGKARVSIPAAFRRVLEAGDPDSPRKRIVMVYGDSRRKYTECYTMAGAAALEEKIKRLALGSDRRRMLERNMITLSVTLEIDDDGRIVLPPKVREKCGISPEDVAKGAEAVFAGALDTFQLWKSDVYDAEILRAAEADLASLPEGVDILSLLSDDEGV